MSEKVRRDRTSKRQGMRKAFGLLLAATFALTSANAGTSTSPEVVDPAGDALVPSFHGTNADWADITKVWFTTVRDANDAVTGFRVHVATLGSKTAPDMDAKFTVSWTVEMPQDTQCFADVTMVRTDAGDGWDEPGATLLYSCDGDARTVVQVYGYPLYRGVPWMNPVSLAYEDLGTEFVATIPLSAFSEGTSQNVYRAATKIAYPSGNSIAMLSLPDGTELSSGLYYTDDTSCNGPRVGSDPCAERKPYVIGS